MSILGRYLRGPLRWCGKKLTYWADYPYSKYYTITLAGDRFLEWSWIQARLPTGPGQMLDFGWGGGPLVLAGAWRGLNVTALDRMSVTCHFALPDSITTRKSDLFDANLQPESFDVIVACSTVEHVGLANRYDHNTGNAEGDLMAMATLRSLLTPEGTLLITLPVGMDRIYESQHRIYGNERLPRLIDGFQQIEEEYWVKREDARWHQCERQEALAFDARLNPQKISPECYALGLLALKAN